MTLRIYNTLSRTKEDFTPVTPGKVGMYLCGPTVYKPAHIGHMVGPVIFDTIKRYLAYSGYDVTWVVNITDVDDKLINRANENDTTVEALANEMTLDYLRTTGDRKLEGTFLNDLGVLQAVRGDSKEAKASMKSAIRISRLVGNRIGEIVGLGNLGDLYLREDRHEDARTHLDEALRMSREIGYSLAEGAYLASLAELALRSGNLEGSRAKFTISEALLREVGDPIELCKLLARRGHLDLAEGLPDAAHQTLAEALDLAEGIGAGPDSELRQLTRSLKKALGA